MYKIDLSIVVFLFGGLSFLIAETIRLKTENYTEYSFGFGSGLGILVFTLLTYFFYIWTKRVVKKHQLDLYTDYKIKYPYLKLVAIAIAALSLFFLMFFVFTIFT